MDYKIDHCDPFDNICYNFWMKLEHCGRYLFAADVLSNANISTVLDLACAEGYGTDLLASCGLKAIGGDVKKLYIMSATERYNSASFVTIDLDGQIPETLNGTDSVVCFETLEHLKRPYVFLRRLKTLLRKDGILILSFPNKLFEKIDENGKNCDPFHLSIFDKKEVQSELCKFGFSVLGIYGQAICNKLYAMEHAAVKNGFINQDEADALHKYDRTSIINMSRIIAYPSAENIDESYSYIFVCRNE